MPARPGYRVKGEHRSRENTPVTRAREDRRGTRAFCTPRRMTRVRLQCVAALVFAIWCVAGVAGVPGEGSASAADSPLSLWDDHTRSLFADHRARQVGDLITVLITERSYASNKAQTSTGKGAGITLAEGVGVFSFLPETGFSANAKSSGQNTTSRSGSLVARMTAKIIEVLPDGNLRIEGTQALVINRERQNIVITGIVRPEDIGSDNTILSTYIADAEIKYDGALNVEQRKGLLSYLGRFFAGILDFLF